ncbi:hypothetical protein CMI39_02215 [Candidatus Pacearchaeota archaeon]|jgi:response regulator RpfG family c-di-GMP phosphodiesterase|nr:hypothetical protein [Candidatus Pacearchaeota archaeon]|tara:strand:- start:1151 stop:2140 length:990 start_codon:yes stop_codon:yes gene_type:complete
MSNRSIQGFLKHVANYFKEEPLVRFNPDYAILPIFSGPLDLKNPLEMRFPYSNPRAISIFPKLRNEKIIRIFDHVLDDKNLTSKEFNKFILKGEIELEGKIDEREVKYYSRIIKEDNLVQAIIANDLDELRLIKNRLSNTIIGLGDIFEFRDPETGMHSRRINHYAGKLAEMCGANQKFIKEIKIQAGLHDAGKMGISDKILLKKGELTKEEWLEMKEHSKLGYNILNRFDGLKLGAEIALYHHEKWDGTGYPKGVIGKNIPLSGRIVALVDVFDALKSKRPYKDIFSDDKTKDIIYKGKANHFDPNLNEKFLDDYKSFKEILERYQDR